MNMRPSCTLNHSGFTLISFGIFSSHITENDQNAENTQEMPNQENIIITITYS